MREFGTICPFCEQAYLGTAHTCNAYPVLSEFQEGGIVCLPIADVTARDTVPQGSAMEGILNFLLNADILNEKAVQAVRRELGDGADPHLVVVAYSNLPLSIQAWCRLATDDSRASDLSGLSKAFLRFAGFLDATNRMPEDVKRYMQPIMELWRD